jgi:hypothetical protein
LIKKRAQKETYKIRFPALGGVEAFKSHSNQTLSDLFGYNEIASRHIVEA